MTRTNLEIEVAKDMREAYCKSQGDDCVSWENAAAFRRKEWRTLACAAIATIERTVGGLNL